jgi:hypothetical protein
VVLDGEQAISVIFTLVKNKIEELL